MDENMCMSRQHSMPKSRKPLTPIKENLLNSECDTALTERKKPCIKNSQ